ncbi:5' exonuclease Apollo [Aplochiton taeniatus]
MNGKVIPHTPLAVDFWKVRRCSHVRIFFLSHMHSDHTVCLTSTWCHRPIYCSQVTAKLLTLKLKVKEQWIHPLEVGDPTLLPLDDIGKEWFTVTLIDANHCPGAVMFLFQGYFGCILYTGDFRYTPSMLQEPCLKTGITIDVLYLDNTNSNPTRTLPSRQQATQQIKEIIQSHPSHRVVIGLYTLGKESLLVELAMEFKTWVEVSYERLETLRVLDLPDVFTTEPGVGRIRAVEQSQIRSANLVQWNREWPTLAILPTSRPLVSFHPNVHVVPYSDHSSYQELEDFVSALQPTSLVPIVGTCIPDTMHALLPGRTRHEVLVPESVQSCMRRQTDVQLRFPELHVLSRRTQRRGPPRGVVFESPDKGTCAAPGDTREAGSKDATEEDMDPEVDGEGSDGSPVALAMDPSPVKDKRGVRDVRSLNVVHNVPEGRRTPESVQSSRLNHSDVASTEVVRKSIGNTAQMQALPLEGNTASRGGTESNDIAVCSEEETDSTVSFEMSTNGSASTELFRFHVSK